jgi:L-fuconolactonase
MKIDAHHHFWRFDADQYAWINDSMAVLRRDFLPSDLEKEIQAVGIEGVVSVQARQSTQETTALLEFARNRSWIKGVVGWLPLVDPHLRGQLDALKGETILKGIRHVVQDEPEDNFILREDFNLGVELLSEYGLTYDILIYERHLPQAIEFVDRHPNQVFVLDHLAKPQVKTDMVEPWRTNILQLAQRPNVYCKISGLVTEADWQSWNESQLTVYLETALEAFGPKRLMFGSDWPVCHLATTYQAWFELVSRFCARLSPAEQSRILGETAVEAYRLS